jgi:hypothetical protein
VHSVFIYMVSTLSETERTLETNSNVWYIRKNGKMIWCRVIKVVYGIQKDMSDCDYQIESIDNKTVYNTIRSRLYKPSK